MPIERSIEIPAAVSHPPEALKGPNKLSNPSIPPYSPVLKLSQRPSVLSDRSVLEAGPDRAGYRKNEAATVGVQTTLSVITNERRSFGRRRGSRSRSWSHGSGRSRRERCHRCGDKRSSGGLNSDHACRTNGRQSRVPKSPIF